MSLLQLSAGPSWTFVESKLPRSLSVDSITEELGPLEPQIDAFNDGEHIAQQMPTPDPAEESLSPLIRLTEFHNVCGKAWLLKNVDILVSQQPKLKPWIECMSLKQSYEVEYTTRGKIGLGLGRYYPTRGDTRALDNEIRVIGNSLHGMPRLLAAVIAPPSTIELDLENANPRILLGICDHLHLKCPNLRLYVENRGDCLCPFDPENFLGVLKPMELSAVEHRARSKDAPIRLLFGGDVEGLSVFGWKLRDELAELRDILVDLFPLLYNTICYANGSIHVKPAFMYYLISTLETVIMKRLIVLCQNQSIAVNSWCADGLDITQTLSASVIEELQAESRAQLDLPQRFADLTANKFLGIKLPIVLQPKKNEISPVLISLGYSKESAREAYIDLSKRKSKGEPRRERAKLPRKETNREQVEFARDGISKAYFDISRPSLDLARQLKYNVIEISEQYLPDGIFQDQCDHLARSPMGSGKTRQLKDTLSSLYAENQGLQILFVTPRESLARWAHAEFQDAVPTLTSYKDTLSVMRATALVVQCESLHLLYDRVKSENLHFDILVLDECESISAQMVSGDTHGKNMRKNVLVYENVARHAGKIIALDGMLSNLTLESIAELRPLTSKRLLLNNYKKAGASRITALRYIPRQENLFEEALMKAITEKKKLVLVFSSVKKCEAYHTLIKTVLKDDAIWILNGFATNRRIELANLTDSWSDEKIRVVMYTSSITVGVNYDPVPEFRFDEQFFVCGSGGPTARDLAQSLLRARHLRNRLCHVLMCDSEPRTAPLTLKDIEERIAKDIDTITIPQYGALEAAPAWLARTFRWRQHEQSLSSSHFPDMMSRYMLDAGYDMKNIRKQGTEIESEFVAPRFEDITVLSDKQCEELSKRKKEGGISIDESFQLEKYYFTKDFKKTPLAEAFAANLWNEGAWDKHDKVRASIAALRVEKYGKDDYSLAGADTLSTYDIFCKHSLLRRTLFKELAKRLDIHKLFSSYAGTKRTISSQIIESAQTWVRENEKSLKMAFGCRTTAKNPQKFTRSIITDILERYGITCVSDEDRKTTNGKRMREYGLTVTVGPLYGHLAREIK